jgi:hypothetical protein
MSQGLSGELSLTESRRTRPKGCSLSCHVDISGPRIRPDVLALAAPESTCYDLWPVVVDLRVRSPRSERPANQRKPRHLFRWLGAPTVRMARR